MIEDNVGKLKKFGTTARNETFLREEIESSLYLGNVRSKYFVFLPTI
jgi:hypothetical protein